MKQSICLNGIPLNGVTKVTTEHKPFFHSVTNVSVSQDPHQDVEESFRLLSEVRLRIGDIDFSGTLMSYSANAQRGFQFSVRHDMEHRRVSTSVDNPVDNPSTKPAERVSPNRVPAPYATPAPAERSAMKPAVNGSLKHACPKCHANDFPDSRAVAIHVRKCDGVKRTREERKKLSSDRYLAKLKKGPQKEPEEEREPLPMRVPEPSAPQDTRVPCLQCGEKFSNARELGLHQTKDHFGADSVRRRSVG